MMKQWGPITMRWGIAIMGIVVSEVALAAGDGGQFPNVLLGLAILLMAGRFGAYIANLLRQSAVLGELMAGVVLGNLILFGFEGFEFLGQTETLKLMAELGVILLLFEVGLESNIKEFLTVGWSALLVASVGVVAPFALGWMGSQIMMPEHSIYVHAFVGATLCATSVGITARVLKDLGQSNRKEAHIILGAAVIDDIMGLLVLAVVTGVIASVNAAGASAAEIPWRDVGMISLKAFVFLIGAFVIGARLAPLLFRFAGKLRQQGMLLLSSLALCFFMSWLAHAVGLAPIVGAFAAGMIIDGTGFEKFFPKNEDPLHPAIMPLSRFFSPLFFVMMGFNVDLKVLGSGSVISIALVLTTLAIMGKQICGFAVLEKKVDRILIGIGMIPRGEVGLIFASIGATLMIGTERVIDEALYAAIVIMVMLTTLVTPPLLSWKLKQKA